METGESGNETRRESAARGFMVENGPFGTAPARESRLCARQRQAAVAAPAVTRQWCRKAGKGFIGKHPAPRADVARAGTVATVNGREKKKREAKASLFGARAPRGLT
jgi:hypothetical protein